MVDKKKSVLTIYLNLNINLLTGQKKGDDGGPVMKLESDVVVGIISWQHKKAPGDNDSPGISADIYSLVEWIKQAAEIFL